MALTSLFRGKRSPQRDMPVPRLGDPHLFGEEPLLMQRVFAAGCRRYMEFGIGGSTLLALRQGAEIIVAVDSDPEWVAAARTHPELAAKIAAGQVHLVHGDIGPVADWGRPAGNAERALWPNYLARGWAEWEALGTLPDLVYVDGRFRVACCLSILVAYAGRPVTPRVMIHDIGPDRPYYDPVFEVFETVESVGSLHLLRPRAEIPMVRVLTRLLEAQFDER